MDAFGGQARAWPVTYASLKPYYLAAERRLQVSGDSVRTPFAGSFEYPLPPHAARAHLIAHARRSSASPRSWRCQPSGRPRPSTAARSAARAITARSVRLTRRGRPSTRCIPPFARRWTQVGVARRGLHVGGRRVDHVTVIDRDGNRDRVSARHFVIAANGVDSCLLLQRSADVPKHSTLGRCYMDHPSFDLAIYGTELDRETRLRQQRADGDDYSVLREDGGDAAGLRSWERSGSPTR